MSYILLQATQDSTGAWIAAAAALLGALVGGLATFLVAWLTLRQNAKAARREQIRLQLNDFYGPYYELQEVAKNISDLFRAKRGEEFNTLVALLQGKEFDENEKILLKQILDINQKRYDLIMTKGGLVDNLELQTLLQRAGTHFRIIQLAYEANQGGEGLKGEIDRFRAYVYPNDLNPVMKAKIDKLQSELGKLNET